MKIMRIIGIIIGMFIFGTGSLLAEDTEYLLSNNYATSKDWLFYGMPRIDTGADYTWVTTGPYKTDGDIIKTDNEEQGTDRVDYTGKKGGTPDMIDGSAGWSSTDVNNSKWTPGDCYGTAVFDLKKTYIITRVEVWAAADKQMAMDYFETLVSTNGESFVTCGLQMNPTPNTGNWVRVAQEITPVEARYVQIRTHNAPGSYQLRLGEMAIWGREGALPH